MNQQLFEKSSESDWQRYDELVGLQGKKMKDGCPEDLYDLPLLYQKLCTQYSIALARSYSPALISALHERVYQGHTLLYRKKGQLRWRFIEFFLSRFPWQLRKQARYFALATCIFYLPAILMGVACFLDSDMLYSVMPASSVSNMETMYNPEWEAIGRTEARESDTDLMMFGHYILNNISIGFRSFAMGILFGIGTVITLGYNGIAIGGVSGHLTGIGYSETFWPFVSGHSAFELTAIVICGAAGLRLAQPVFAPGRFTRVHGLKIAGRESVELVMGAAVMLVAAAFIEAFWSSSTSVQPLLKYAVGIFFWVLLILYFLSAGKSYHAG